ncbi:MAG: cytochrome c biosis protein CcmG, thiol:disulfide interchange protein DsbE [Sphingomonadales bacterium]|jgi:cytochrome c biogenesis protein CcmG/thiol:disulfide interchange protein DsbE|nr:cytochrome c biosis protein CcmG, thiol:disulfide interchange protein DsbE [Sphingomonadales bacterium]
MSRGLRLIPIILLLWFVIGLAWRLVKPGDTAIPSQMVERQVPRFQLPAAIGNKPGLASADLATGQPRLLNIFASWCVPCIGEAPVLRELQRRGVRIDAIAVRDTPGALNAFLARNGDPYERIGADRQSEVQIALGSSGVPETFVIDGKGVIRRQYIGPLNASNIPGVLGELEQVR